MSSHRSELVGRGPRDRCVFLGNAANTLHPTAAQGLNLGFRDSLLYKRGFNSNWFR